MQAGSAYQIGGTATFQERKDGKTTITIALTGLSGANVHPVHLHMGDISTDKAAVAAILTDVDGKTGTSTTIISTLGDGTVVTYKSGCIERLR